MSRRIECKNDIICARPRQKTTGTLCEQMCSLPFFSRHRKGLGVYLSNHGFYVGRGGTIVQTHRQDNCWSLETHLKTWDSLNRGCREAERLEQPQHAAATTAVPSSPHPSGPWGAGCSWLRPGRASHRLWQQRTRCRSLLAPFRFGQLGREVLFWLWLRRLLPWFWQLWFR